MTISRKIIIAIGIMACIPQSFAAVHQGFPVIVRLWQFIMSLATTTGIAVMTMSIMNLVLALKSEDADAKEKSIRGLAVSIGLIAIGVIVDPVLNAVGFYAI